VIEVTIVVEDGMAIAKDAKDAESSKEAVDFDELRLKTIGVFTERLASDDIGKRRELETLGEHLYVGLFTNSVRTFLEERLKKATTSEPLRLRLRLPEWRYRASGLDSQLADLPWEYLYCPSLRHGFFLTARVMLVLSRYLPPSGEEQDSEPERGALRVGIVYANPVDADLPYIESTATLDSLRDLPKRNANLTVSVLENPRLEDVEPWMGEFRPHVLHYVGHGGRDPDGFAKIILVDAAGRGVDVGDSELATAMQAANHVPSVVLLQLPERSGGRNVEPNLARLAPGLIQNGVPAVVAMQHPFSEVAAKHFCSAFYAALAKGDSIERAVTAARQSFQRRVPKALDNRAFGTPVLYARAFSPVVKAPVVDPGGDDGPPEAAGRGWEPSAQPVTAAGAGPRQPGGQPAAPPIERGEGVPDPDASTGPASGANGDGGRSVPIVMAGARAMNNTVPPLDADRKATVRRWFWQLDAEFLKEAKTPDDIGEAIRVYWHDRTHDERLRSVARVMEETARRQVW
jgi:CHAT domain